MTLPHDPRIRDWLDTVLASTTDYAVILADADGLIVAWLGAAERHFGYATSEAIGMPLAAIFTPEDRALGLDRHEMALAVATGRSEDDRWHLRKDGGRFWASGILHAVKQPDGSVPALCKLVRDRTDMRTQLEALQNKVQARDEELARRENFVVSLSHELRNPIAPILNCVELLKRSTDPAATARAREVLVRQVGVLTTLLDDFHQAASPPDAGLAMNIERISIQDALSLAADSSAAAAAARSQTLSLTLPEQTLWIPADPSRLQQMLANLLGNAIKYTPEGGRIDLSATIEGTMLIIRIEDDGMGISPEMLPHIFELFAREERHHQIDGLGVGLAVVKQLAALHGGGIEARSPGAGKGSVFRLRLPLEAPLPRTPE